MALSGPFIQDIKSNGFLGNSTVNCSVLGDRYTSEFLRQPGHMPLSDVSSKEESTYAASFCFNGLCMPVSHNRTSVNSIVDSVTDALSMEKPVKKKKKRNNKQKGKSTKEISDKIDSETVPSKSGLDDALPSCQSAKETRDSMDFNSDKCSRNDTSLADSPSQCESHMYGFSKDPSVSCHEDLNMSKQGPEEIIAKSLTKDICGGLLSQCKSCETMNVKPCKVEDCSGCCSENTKTSSHCSSTFNVHPISTSNKNQCNYTTFQCDAVNQTSRHRCTRKGKEFVHLMWQKRERNVREAQIVGENRLNCIYVERDVNLLEKKFLVKHNSPLSNRFLPCPLVSSSRRKVLVESSQWTAQHRLNETLFQYVPKSNQVGAHETEDFGKIKSNHSFKSGSNCRSKKQIGCSGENCFRFHNQFVFSKRESVQVPCGAHHYGTHHFNNSNKFATRGLYYLHSSPASFAHVRQNVQCSTKYSLPFQSGFQAYNGMRIPRMNHLLGTCFHASTGRQQYEGFGLYNDYKFRKDATSGTNGKKWIPVGTKQSRVQERTVSAGICNGSYESSSSPCNGVNDSHPKGQTIPLCGPAALSDSKCTSFISSHKITSVESEAPKIESLSAEIEIQKSESTKDSVAYCKSPKDNPELINCSEMAVQALTAAYKLQLASEGIELSMGCPLAEFERLIHCAAPVIASSYIYKKCAVCLDSQLSHSLLCKHQIPNISLPAVWNWYEKPGNYGLEVKAEDSRKLKGPLNESISFHAYFVPFLSAVQLFGYPHLSNCCGKSKEPVNCEMRDKREVELHSSSPKTLFVAHSIEAVEVKVKEPVIPSKVSPDDGGDCPSFHSLPIRSSNSELIFEFFESEQPQQRKPLYNKIMELMNARTSNLQVFGDPSKLESSDLRDLHPASWFSVAWYPIYRIPEGNFRASFLTYHSLGHLVQKCVPTGSLNKKASSIVSPVLGLQSYNALGECWFDLKIPAESSFKASSPFNSSKILKERLKTLEENALLFARGCVCKNNVKVCNRQPDYEFFISRKH